MPSNPTHTSEELKKKLLSAHSLLNRRMKQDVLLGAFLVVLACLASLIIIEQNSYFSSITKISFLIALVTIAITVIWIGIKRVISADFIEFYRAFSRNSNIKELSYALDMEKSSFANPKLVEAAIYKNLELVKPNEFNQKLDEFISQSSISKRYRSKTLLSLFLVLATGFSAFNFDSASYRLANFWLDFEKPNPFIYAISPGNETIEQGSAFSVSIEFEGQTPDEVTLMLKSPIEQEYRRRGMDGTLGSFHSASFDLNTDISYYVEMDGFKSVVYEASVQLRPRFTTLTTTIVPPSYTRLDTVSYTYPFSDIDGIQGSEVIVSGELNKEVSEFLIQHSVTDDELVDQQGLGFEYRYTLTEADTLSFKITDGNGLQNLNTFRFLVHPVADEYPYVELLEPTESFEAIDPSALNMLFRANDDFGLTRATFNYELQRAFVDEPIIDQISLERPVNGILQRFDWDLTPLELKPKDELTFWIEVSDNDGFNGSKTARSEQLTLTIPSLIDFFEDIGEEEEEVQTDLESISESFEEMQEQYELFREQLIENPEVNYEQQRQIQEVQQQQEEIEERIEELNERFDEIKEELTENNLLSEETMEAYEELQQLMEEIDDPAFREALEQLQEQMGRMTPEQLREAMEEVEFNEQLYQERLERTIELFKQLMLNSELERLAQSYEDLARQEEELQNSDPTTQEEQEQRESTQEQIEQLQQQLDDLSENTTSQNQQSVNELQESSQEELEAIREELERRLEELREQMEGNENQSSDQQEGSEEGEQQESEQGEPNQQQNRPNQQQPNLQQRFEQLAEETRQMMQQMNQEQMQINIAGLQYVLYSLLNLSIEQEDLVTYATVTENRSQAYVEYARDQKNVDDIFKFLSDSLFELSADIPGFSNQINEKKLEVENFLEQSLTQMAERNQPRASVATRQALGGINEISFLIANLLEQLQNQGQGQGGGGSMSMQQMLQQMQQMGEDQQQLNQQIQNFINDMQGERLTQDRMERLDQLSRQQNAIRQQLQELQRSENLEAGDKLGSDLERMIEEMEETINDLRGGAVDPTLVERQQNILSRMLEAEESMQERGEEEEREGSTAIDILPTTPPELTLEELEKQIRNRLNDPNFTKYSADYQRLIEKYFELLKEIQNREIQ